MPARRPKAQSRHLSPAQSAQQAGRAKQESVFSLFRAELLFRHSMRVDNLPLTSVVDFQREKEACFQVARLAPITRRIKDCGIRISPLAHLQNVVVLRATARVKVFWQMAL